MTKGIYKQGDKWKAKVMLGGTRYTGIFLTVLAAEAWILECRAAFKLGKPIPPANGETAPNGASKLGTIRARPNTPTANSGRGTPTAGPRPRCPVPHTSMSNDAAQTCQLRTP